MTREEAIDLLSEITMYCDFTDEYGDYINDEPYITAVDMAIECLQSSEMWNRTTTDKRIFAPKGTFQKVFEDGKTEPCEDCVYSTNEGYCQYEDITEAIPPLEPCEDCISRQAVLEQAIDYGSKTFLIPVNSVKALPSVTPQRKESYWIEESDDEYTTIYCYRCSNCGNCNEDDTDYCPDCGCLMTDVRGDEG